MKANEFVLEHGWDAAKRLVENNKHTGRTLSPSELELKRLVESHELVEKLGGMEKCKILIAEYGNSESAAHLSYHVENVESCQ